MAQSVPLVLRLLASSVTAAKCAGNILREVVGTGGDQSIVLTEAKRSIQRCIRVSLCQQHPNLKIVEEKEKSNDETPTECVVTDCDDDILSQQCPTEYVNVTSKDLVVWIDVECMESPLTHATAFVGISMKEKAIGGVIHYVEAENPSSTDRTLWGLVHLGTGGFQTEELPSGTVTLTVTEVQDNDLLTTVLDVFQPDEVLRGGGVGSSFIKLLEGKAHVYIFPSKECTERRICALEALLTAMGGKLTDIHGNTLEYRRKMVYTNVCGILATGKDVDHSSFVEQVPQGVRDAIPVAQPSMVDEHFWNFILEDVISHDEMMKLFENFKYVGFDPVKVKDSLMAVPGFTYEDMCACSYFFLSKGTNLTRILQKLNPPRKRELQGLISKYNLVSKIDGPEAVTLARVAGCFPLTVLENLKKYREDRMSRPVKQEYFRSFSRVQFPRILMCNAIASLIPTKPFSTVTQSDLDKIIALITIYSAVESTFLNREHRDKCKKELYNIADTYVQLAYKSSIKSEEERQALVTYGQFAGVIDNCLLNPDISRLHDDLITHFKD